MKTRHNRFHASQLAKFTPLEHWFIFQTMEHINTEISGNLSILRRSIFRGVYKTLKVAFSLAPALFLENGLDIGKDFILSDGDVNSRQFPMKVKILILETFFDNQSFYER